MWKTLRLLAPAALAAGMLLSLRLVLPARATPAPHLGYGFMVADRGNLDTVAAAGFDWFKTFLEWRYVEPVEAEPYNWVDLDDILTRAANSGLNVIVRVDRAPDWARAWAHETAPVRPDKLLRWQLFFKAIAEHTRQKMEAHGWDFLVAYEVWNEPNLDREWGGQPVDPLSYTLMVQYAYTGTKAGDPAAIVVAGALATTGGTGDGAAMNDVAYLEAMYDAGLRGYFDVIGVHNYGYAFEPECKSCGSGILNFRRAEDIHAVMEAHGDGDKQVWSTEFGWLLDPAEEGVTCTLPGFDWMKLPALTQANYLTRAFAYADENWPWMGVMVVSNLDFSMMPWYDTCEPLRWFAVLRPDGSPRLAYTATLTMSKNYANHLPQLVVTPTLLLFSANLHNPGVQTACLSVENAGYLYSDLSWTATVDISATLVPSITPTSGRHGQLLTVTVNSTGYATGTYTGTITIIAVPTWTLNSPYTVPVRLEVVPVAPRSYLPLILRTSP